MTTIYAPATPPGRSGVGVIRVSGPEAYLSLEAVTGRKDFKPRQAILTNIIDPVSRETIDHALVLTFKSPQSYTGEDIVEYHLHGSTVIINSVLDIFSQQKNHKLADPGEFTRRAFENGKLDLTEAEAVADLIDAETAQQRRQALSQLEGQLSSLYARWNDMLKENLAHLEAEIEFPDEDLPVNISEKFAPFLETLSNDIITHLDDNQRGERLRDGIQIAIIGAPNVGKSSLINLLTQRDIAIVSDMAGTTRDVVEAHLDIGGYPVIIADTAGLRPEDISDEGQDQIEAEGIRRALKKAQDADIRLLMFDAGQSEPDQKTLKLQNDQSLLILNKTDQNQNFELEGALSISVQENHNIDALLDLLQKKIETLYGLSEKPSLTRKRHRQALEQAKEALERAQQADLPELVAEDMRLAIRYFGSITGKVDVEDLLDVIFSDFCIGK